MVKTLSIAFALSGALSKSFLKACQFIRVKKIWNLGFIMGVLTELKSQVSS